MSSADRMAELSEMLATGTQRFLARNCKAPAQLRNCADPLDVLAEHEAPCGATHEGAQMNVADQIATLQTKATAELAAEYTRVLGKPPRYRSAPWMRKRIAFKLQENAYGGLPRVARDALAALCAEIALPTGLSAPTAPTTRNAPRPNSVLTRVWKGMEVRVLVTDDGFEWNGQRFGSLSAVALAITGAKWNGKLFFGLVERKRA